MTLKTKLFCMLGFHEYGDPYWYVYRFNAHEDWVAIKKCTHCKHMEIRQ